MQIPLKYPETDKNIYHQKKISEASAKILPDPVEPDDMTEACQLFESAAKKQKDLRVLSRYAKMYDSIIAKHAEGSKFLQNSIEVLEKEKEKIAYDNLTPQMAESSPHKYVKDIFKNPKLNKDVFNYITSLPYTDVKPTVKNLISGSPDSTISQIIKENSNESKINELIPNFSQKQLNSIQKLQTPSRIGSRIGGNRARTPGTLFKASTKNTFNTKANYITKNNEINYIDSNNIPQSGNEKSIAQKATNLNNLRFSLNQSEIKEKAMQSVDPKSALLLNRKTAKSNANLQKKLESRNRIERQDYSQVYQTFVNYYNTAYKGRKNTPGPLDYMAKKHIVDRDNNAVMELIKHIKQYKRKKPLLIIEKNEVSAAIAAASSALIKQKSAKARNLPRTDLSLVNRSLNSEKSRKDPPNFCNLIKSFNNYAKDFRHSIQRFRSDQRNLRKQFISMKRKLDDSTGIYSSKEVVKVIKNNVERFKKEKVCFVYGENGKGRYMFLNENGKIRDKLKDGDCILGLADTKKNQSNVNKTFDIEHNNL